MPRGTQIINGTEYVYEYDSKWDSKKQYGTHRRNYIGKMVDGIFVPNKNYKLKFEFENTKKAIVSNFDADIKYKHRFYGATYLLDMIGQKLGIIDDLKKCFPDSYEQMLSIVYYLIMEDYNSLNRFPKWALTHVHPFEKNINSILYNELLGSINDKARYKFFLLQDKRRFEKEYLAYDINAISTFSNSSKQIKIGFNKESESLQYNNLILLLGEESRLPIYYNRLAGNISHVKMIQNIMTDIEFLKKDRIKLIMDRGFYSEDNIDAIYQKHYKFILNAKISLKYIQKKLNEVRKIILSKTHYSSKFELNYYSSLLDYNNIDIKQHSEFDENNVRRMYLHIYYSVDKAAEDKAKLNSLIEKLRQELVSGYHKPEHEKLYEKYFEMNENLVKGTMISSKQEAIKTTEKNFGYFALITNCFKEPLEALEIYWLKDDIEHTFGNFKERLSMKRKSVSSDENFDGKFFIQFISLIYLSYIKNNMNNHLLYKNYSPQEIIDELDMIERFEQPGRKYHVGELTKKQNDLYAMFGVEAPREMNIQ